MRSALEYLRQQQNIQVEISNKTGNISLGHGSETELGICT